MNARQLAQRLLLLAMEHPDEEIEVVVAIEGFYRHLTLSDIEADSSADKKIIVINT